MFNPLKKSLRLSLTQLFESGYQRTEKYRESYETLIKGQEQQRKGNKVGQQSCIGYWCLCQCLFSPKIEPT
jgi:hypothetical protein